MNWILHAYKLNLFNLPFIKAVPWKQIFLPALTTNNKNPIYSFPSPLQHDQIKTIFRPDKKLVIQQPQLDDTLHLGNDNTQLESNQYKRKKRLLVDQIKPFLSFDVMPFLFQKNPIVFPLDNQSVHSPYTKSPFSVSYSGTLTQLMHCASYAIHHLDYHIKSSL